MIQNNVIFVMKMVIIKTDCNHELCFNCLLKCSN